MQILDWPKSILLLPLRIKMEHLRTKEGGMRWEETVRRRASVSKRDVS